MTRRDSQLRSTSRGVTLVELVVFIVIAALVAVAMVQAFSGATVGSHEGKDLTQATQVAQQRMELILGQRHQLGFAGFDANTFDPCDAAGAAPWTAAACSGGAYTATTTFNAPVPACAPACKEISVTVADPRGNVLARLAYQTWDY